MNPNKNSQEKKRNSIYPNKNYNCDKMHFKYKVKENNKFTAS